MVFISTVVRVLLVVSATLTHLVLSTPDFDGRILGGIDADIRDYPYQVSVQFYNTHICGGSIISPGHVLTSAHCTNSKSASSLSILFGVSHLEDVGTRVAVQKIYQHPDYNSNDRDNDVSVLKLALVIIPSSTARIIPLAIFEPIAAGIPLFVTGWSPEERLEIGSRKLQGFEVELISRSSCKTTYQGAGIEIGHRFICGRADLEGNDACQGDSGGPLVQTVIGAKVQVGVVTWGAGCAGPNYPGVYANVAQLRGFINQAMLDL